MYTGRDRFSLQDLCDYVPVMIAERWKELGVKLLGFDETVRMIEADNRRDSITYCKLVLKKWLEVTPDATWNQLIRALRSPSVNCDSFADYLEQMPSAQSFYGNVLQ